MSWEKPKNSSLLSYLPAALVIVGSVLLVLLRIQTGGEHFISDSALMMLALASYLTAAVFHLTNLYAPSNWAQKLGLWCATAGVFFNLSSWGVRWVAAYDREYAVYLQQGRLSEMGWVFRYIPFANLYDLSLAFAFGAGVVWNNDVGLADRVENGDDAVARLGIVAADQPIIFAATKKRRVQIILGQTLIGPVDAQDDPLVGVGGNIIGDDPW